MATARQTVKLEFIIIRVRGIMVKELLKFTPVLKQVTIKQAKVFEFG